jgi:hypothetical protein
LKVPNSESCIIAVKEMITRVFAILLLILRIQVSVSRLPRVWAHYLPWYDTEKAPPSLVDRKRYGWCASSQNCSNSTEIQYTNKPLIGEYSQFDNETLEYHLLGASVAGMDGFIINWDPNSDFQTVVIDNLFAQAEKLNMMGSNMSLMVSFDTSQKNLDQMKAYFVVLQSRWVNSTAYFKDDDTGYPVVFLWSDSAMTNYSDAARAIFNNNILLVARNAVDSMAESEANFQWVTPSAYYVSNTSKDWGSGYYNDFDWVMARQKTYLGANASLNYIAVGGVWPGFDDKNVPYSWNGGDRRLINRNVRSGRVSELSWEYILNYSPLRLGGEISVAMPWVQVITWNDWPEGTSIEPATSTTYGNVDYIICRNYTMQFKGLVSSSGINIENIVALPYQIYQARKASFAEASAAVKAVAKGQYDLAYLLLNVLPTNKPSPAPSLTTTPTIHPSPSPSNMPTYQPTSTITTIHPSPSPSNMPTYQPTSTITTIHPSPSPSNIPTYQPTSTITTIHPSPSPSNIPTYQPTSTITTIHPSPSPSNMPTRTLSKKDKSGIMVSSANMVIGIFSFGLVVIVIVGVGLACVRSSSQDVTPSTSTKNIPTRLQAESEVQMTGMTL